MKAHLSRSASLTLLLLLAADGAAKAGQQPELMTLRGAISEALQRSPALEGADDLVAAADIRRKQAASRFHPQLSPIVNTETAPGAASRHVLGVSVSQLLPTGAVVQSSVSVTRHGSGPAAIREGDVNVGVSQPLLRGFGVVARADVEAAARATELARHAVADSRQQLVLRVAQAYFAVVRAQRLDVEGRLALERAEKLADMSDARVRVGLATKLDVYRAGLLLAQARAATLDERDRLASAREDLNMLLARPPGSIIVADENVTAIVNALPSPDPGAMPTEQPAPIELVEARTRLADARRTATTAWWNDLPGVTLDVSYTRRGLGIDTGASPFAGLSGWRVSLSSTHLFESSAPSTSSALASMNVRAAERAVVEAGQRAVVNLDRARRDVTRAAALVAVHRTAVDLAAEQRDLAAMRFERGLAGNLELIDAEGHLFQAHSARIGSEIDHALALLAWRRVSGTLDPDTVLR